MFDALTPAPDIGPPPADPGLTAAVVARVTPSTVKIIGHRVQPDPGGERFRRLGQDVVVTNAHVVAGEDATQVERNDGALLDATVVVFDPTATSPCCGSPASPGPAARRRQRRARPAACSATRRRPARVCPFVVGDEVRAVGTDIYDPGGPSARC